MSGSGASVADVLEADVVVIGGGPAGEVIAGRCADRGMDVLLAESELVGGECSYWGCIPSKTLVRPGDVLAAARRVPGAGAELSLSDLQHAVPAFPTVAEVWLHALEAAGF